MRTVKNANNFKLREKGWAVRDGLEISLCSENRFPKNTRNLNLLVLILQTTTIVIIIAAGRGWAKRKKQAMRDEHTHAHC